MRGASSGEGGADGSPEMEGEGARGEAWMGWWRRGESRAKAGSLRAAKGNRMEGKASEV